MYHNSRFTALFTISFEPETKLVIIVFIYSFSLFLRRFKMKRQHIFFKIIVISLFLLQPTFAALPRYEVIDLGTLGGLESRAYSINDSGQVVGLAKNSEDYTRATLFDPTGSGNNLDLGTLGGEESRASSINAVGQIVGDAKNISGYYHATLFDPTGDANNIDLGTSGRLESWAGSINNIGQIVGSSKESLLDKHAILFDPTGAGLNIELGTLGGNRSCAFAINDSGQIIGDAEYSSGLLRATLFDPTGDSNNIDLGTLTGPFESSSSQAISINNSGQVVGYTQARLFPPFREMFLHATLFDITGSADNIDLGTLYDSLSFALSINDSGKIVGSVLSPVDWWQFLAVLFDPSGNGNNIDLNTLIDPSSGWILEEARSINNLGWIVGYGINPSGDTHAYLLIPKTLIIYVDDDATGANDGSSWTDAFNYIQDALSAAWPGDEIHVARGIYKPDQGAGIALGDREATFQLINGVTLKGGYAGLGQPDPNAHDIQLYETVLNGDLSGDDGPDFANNNENSYHVVTGSGTDETAVIDGFTITAANADGFYPKYQGGGLFNYPGSPTINNCTFTGNYAVNGGGMYNHKGSCPKLTECTFTQNRAGDGAGMYNNYYSTPTLTNCFFSDNHAGSEAGAAYYSLSNSTLENCTFTRNTADYKAGAMYIDRSDLIMVNCSFSENSSPDGGGLFNYDSDPVLTNCVFSDNFAHDDAGGVCNTKDDEECNPMFINCAFSRNRAGVNGGAMSNISGCSVTLTNCTFGANIAGNNGGGVFSMGWRARLTVHSCTFVSNLAGYGAAICGLYDISADIRNCTFADNSAYNGNALAFDSPYGTPGPSDVQIINSIIWDGDNVIWNNNDSIITITYSDIKSGWPGEGNIDVDPLFRDPDGIDDIPGTEDDNLRLSIGSPCIDAGDPNYVAEPNETDLDGRPRLFDGNDDGIAVVDMGAYEYGQLVPAEARIVPKTINLASKGKWITAFLWLPEDYSVTDIDPNSVLLEGHIKPERFWLTEDNQVAIAKFDREQVQAMLTVGDIKLTITGQLADGTSFEASDIIKVIDKGGKN